MVNDGHFLPMSSAARFLFGSLLAFAGSAHADVPWSDAGVGTNALGSAPPPPPPLETSVVAEPPYKLGERPRAEGVVLASVADELVARWGTGGSSNPSCASNRLTFHPAPRVKVDTVVVRGRLPARSAKKGVLSELAVLAQTRNHGYWPFRLCFEAGLRRDAPLVGKTHVRMAIAPSGHVTSSRLESTELRDNETSTCLAAGARALRFSPGPARRTEVDVTVDLTPGDAPLPDGAGLRSGATLDPGPGTLDADAVGAALDATLPAIAACYAEGRAADPELWGRVALRFDEDTNGVVRSVVQHDTRFPAPPVVSCVLASVRGVRLPKVVGGAVRFVWGVRLGVAPSLETAVNVASGGPEKSAVADSPPTRVGMTR